MTKATKTARKATKTAKKMMTPSAKKRKKGFTLIELLIVVGILAVVAAVAIPNLTRFMGEGKEEAWESDQSTISTAVQAYRFENDDAWPLIAGTDLGAPVWDGAGETAVQATDCNGMIDIDSLISTTNPEDNYLSKEVDSACGFNYAAYNDADSKANDITNYGHWCWYVNGAGQIRATYFDSITADPTGDDWDSATDPAYP
jgi:prepilin-type N-terminal cleavage/methylation domain-containing protein